MTATPKPNKTCPLCGGPNECAPAQCGSFDVDCWCRDTKFSPEVLARVPQSQRDESCICRRCAAATSRSQEPER